jgi:predicted O-methyltransferase YrrM
MYGIYHNLEWLMRGWLLSLIATPNNNLNYGVELGTYQGGTTFFLLDNVPNLTLHTVDIFEQQPEHGSYNHSKYDFEDRYPAFLKRAKKYGDRLIIHKGWTHEVAKDITDGSLDFVFVDADHDYEAVKRDILTWRPKIRPGGYLMGHDINKVSVNKAVMECCNADANYDHYCWIEVQPLLEEEADG